MSPGEISTLAASLAESDLPAGSRGVLLSIAAATGPDCVAHLSAGRLAERCGLSRGHVQRVIKQLEEAGFVQVEVVPGRASRLHISVPVRCSAGAPPGANTCSAGAPGVSRGRARGVAPARHVSSIPPSQLPTRAAAAGPDGPPPPAWDSAFVPDDGHGLPSRADRIELMKQVREQLRSRAVG